MDHLPTLGTHMLCSMQRRLVGCPVVRHAPAQAFQLTYGYQHSATAGVLLDVGAARRRPVSRPRDAGSHRLSAFHVLIRRLRCQTVRHCSALFYPAFQSPS